MLRIQHFSQEQSVAHINKVISLIPRINDIFLSQNLSPHHLVSTYPELSSSPLFLSMLLFIILYNGESKNIKYEKKSDLYLKHFNLVYQNAFAKKEEKNFPENKDLIFVISELAIKILMAQNRNDNPIYLTKENLYELVSSLDSIKLLQLKPNNISRIILEDLSYFTIKDGYYNFIHESFFHFFCAYFIKEYDPKDVFVYTGLTAPFNEYSTRLIYDYIYEMKESVIHDYLFIDFFKAMLGNELNHPTYEEFLKTFHADITITKGSVEISDIAQNSNYDSHLIFEYFKEKICGYSCNLYCYEDDDLYDAIESEYDENDKNFYRDRYYRTEANPPYYIEKIDEYEEMKIVSSFDYDGKDEPCGYSIQISNLYEIDQKKYPELYNFVYNNPDFEMKKEYNKMIEFLDEYKNKNLSK